MTTQKYYLGCTGWSLNKWKGRFYADKARPGEFLSQYASVFNTVEGNTTFYHTPAPDTVRKWGRQTPEGFRFCFKFPRTITHDKLLNNTNEEVQLFLERFEPIVEKLGPFLIQLPPQFSFRQFSSLEALLRALPERFSYAVEVRHDDFFDHGPKEKRLNGLLQSYNIDRVVFDTRKLHAMKSREATILEAQRKKPRVPVRFVTTASHPMVRFVGANDPVANQPYLKEWAIIIADWIREGRHPYIFTHSPDRVSQPHIARTFHRLLADLLEMDPMPPWPAERQNEQLDLF